VPKSATVKGQGTRVVVEVGSTRVFASAIDWPGWSRSGKTEQAALEALAAYAPRYEAVLNAAGIPFPKRAAADLTPIERLPGSATTDYGAPGAPAAAESEPMSKAETDRMCALVTACWKAFDRVVKAAPAELRKGPRGGGRDRDKIVEHVFDAEAGYSPKLALKLKSPRAGDRRSVTAHREALLDAFRAGADGKPLREGGWTARYAARRIAWHAMDHAWEIEDRSET
jgi:hypothetical protein